MGCPAPKCCQWIGAEFFFKTCLATFPKKPPTKLHSYSSLLKTSPFFFGSVFFLQLESPTHRKLQHPKSQPCSAGCKKYTLRALGDLPRIATTLVSGQCFELGGKLGGIEISTFDNLALKMIASKFTMSQFILVLFGFNEGIPP